MNDTRQQLLDNILGVVAELENGDTCASDWLDEQLCIEGYTVDAEGAYKGAEITVSFGGPTIWVETENGKVHGVWGSDSFERSYSDNIGLDDLMEEIHSYL